jgi:hypothetical protein
MILKTESDLKHLLVEKLSGDFELVSEVKGRNLLDNTLVRIDFLAKAKLHTLKSGITTEWFGIEVKYISQNHIGGQINKVFWQSITYSQSIFDIGKPPFLEKKRLPFIFVLVNTKAITYHHQQRFSCILSFCQYSNVGQLILNNQGYTFQFGGGIYCQKNKDTIVKGPHNVGERRYIGNVFSSKIRSKNAKP